MNCRWSDVVPRHQDLRTPRLANRAVGEGSRHRPARRSRNPPSTDETPRWSIGGMARVEARVGQTFRRPPRAHVAQWHLASTPAQIAVGRHGNAAVARENPTPTLPPYRGAIEIGTRPTADYVTLTVNNRRITTKTVIAVARSREGPCRRVLSGEPGSGPLPANLRKHNVSGQSSQKSRFRCWEGVEASGWGSACEKGSSSFRNLRAASGLTRDQVWSSGVRRKRAGAGSPECRDRVCSIADGRPRSSGIPGEG